MVENLGGTTRFESKMPDLDTQVEEKKNKGQDWSRVITIQNTLSLPDAPEIKVRTSLEKVKPYKEENAKEQEELIDIHNMIEEWEEEVNHDKSPAPSNRNKKIEESKTKTKTGNWSIEVDEDADEVASEIPRS